RLAVGRPVEVDLTPGPLPRHPRPCPEPERRPGRSEGLAPRGRPELQPRCLLEADPVGGTGHLQVLDRPAIGEHPPQQRVWEVLEPPACVLGVPQHRPRLYSITPE